MQFVLAYGMGIRSKASIGASVGDMQDMPLSFQLKKSVNSVQYYIS